MNEIFWDLSPLGHKLRVGNKSFFCGPFAFMSGECGEKSGKNVKSILEFCAVAGTIKFESDLSRIIDRVLDVGSTSWRTAEKGHKGILSLIAVQ